MRPPATLVAASQITLGVIDPDIIDPLVACGRSSSVIPAVLAR